MKIKENILKREESAVMKTKTEQLNSIFTTLYITLSLKQYVWIKNNIETTIIYEILCLSHGKIKCHTNQGKKQFIMQSDASN
jgi:hypothetical protein